MCDLERAGSKACVVLEFFDCKAEPYFCYAASSKENDSHRRWPLLSTASTHRPLPLLHLSPIKCTAPTALALRLWAGALPPLAPALVWTGYRHFWLPHHSSSIFQAHHRSTPRCNCGLMDQTRFVRRR